MHPLETYLAEIATLRGATKETSGYPALANLLNAVGHTLKPKVRCIIHPKNSGAGIPDGGLFTPDQLKNRDDQESFIDQKPARGVIEVKSTRDEIAGLAELEQVGDYLKHYGLILLTNYRSFLLLKRGDNGKPVHLESFQLASDEKSFWIVAAQPRKAAGELGERLVEYLKRVMLHAAPLNNPKDVAFFLASYARDARARVEATKDLPQLAAVRTALEEALGMKFTAGKGEHFFRSTLVQTLFYGVFSAWVLWHKEKPQRKDAFDWKSASWTLHVPIISALFHQVADPLKLRPLGLDEILDWTAAALNRVIREEFSPGIQQGVAISLCVKTGKKQKKSILFRDDLNEAKAADRRAHLLETLNTKKFDAQYEKAEPSAQNRFSFRPSDVAAHYLEWPALIDLCAEAPSNGLMEKRGGALMDIDRVALENRMRDYFDPNVSWDELKALKTGLTKDAARFGAEGAREIILKVEEFQPNHLLRYSPEYLTEHADGIREDWPRIPLPKTRVALLAALILLQPELDKNYSVVKAATVAL